MLNNIDKSLRRHNYSTRTEFLRDAIREKLESMNKEELIKELMKFRGMAKKRVSEKEYRQTRERVFKEFAKERGWDY